MWLGMIAETQELAHPTGCSFHTSAASESPLFVSSTSSSSSVTLSERSLVMDRWRLGVLGQWAALLRLCLDFALGCCHSS